MAVFAYSSATTAANRRHAPPSMFGATSQPAQTAPLAGSKARRADGEAARGDIARPLAPLGTCPGMQVRPFLRLHQ